MRLQWLDKASADLDEIFAFISSDDPIIAGEQLMLITESVGRLPDNPSIGRPGRVPDTRELIVSCFIVAYRVRNHTIQILRVLHHSRRWPKTF